MPLGVRHSVVYGIITILAAGLGAWFASFLKTKGQNFATKKDFNELQKQLKANTELVETIKSEVGQRDWAQREWTNLRRIKLEALLEKMHECEAYLDRCRKTATGGAIPEDDHDYFSELDTISTLYCREVRKESDDFVLACHEDVCIAYPPRCTTSRDMLNKNL